MLMGTSKVPQRSTTTFQQIVVLWKLVFEMLLHKLVKNFLISLKCYIYMYITMEKVPSPVSNRPY